MKVELLEKLMDLFAWLEKHSGKLKEYFWKKWTDQDIEERTRKITKEMK